MTFKVGSLVRIKPEHRKEVFAPMSPPLGSFVERMRVPGLRLIINIGGNGHNGKWTLVAPDGTVYDIMPEHQWLYEEFIAEEEIRHEFP